jgi:carbon starvation protein
VDAGTRGGRYLIQEVAGQLRPRWGDINDWKPVFVTSALVCGGWGYLLYQNDISSIWPMFGVANQLLATLALVVGSGYLLRHSSKRRYALLTGIPALVMAATTLTAGVSNIFDNYLPRGRAGDPNGYLNAVLTLVMMVCVGLVLVDGLLRVRKLAAARAGGDQPPP